MSLCHGKAFLIDATGYKSFEFTKEVLNRELWEKKFQRFYLITKDHGEISYQDIPYFNFVEDINIFEDSNLQKEIFLHELVSDDWRCYRYVIVVYNNQWIKNKIFKELLHELAAKYEIETYSSKNKFLENSNWDSFLDHVDRNSNEMRIRNILEGGQIEEDEVISNETSQVITEKKQVIDLNESDKDYKPKKNEVLKKEKILQILAGLQQQINSLKAELEEI